jgi:hypothetical protein
MVRAAHAVMSCVDILCGRNSVARMAKDNMNNINVLAFYHEIRWNLEVSRACQTGDDPSVRGIDGRDDQGELSQALSR